MRHSEVFVPSSGPLLVRGPVEQGPALPLDTFRKSRPATQSGYRFGHLSHNSFFTRHNPHPTRVRHLKGLLDVPICTVNDDGYFANPRYSLQFPPNNYNLAKLSQWRHRIPVNLSSQLRIFDTITGLQNYPFKEKAIPKLGLVPVNEGWRDELRNLTDQIYQFQDELRVQKEINKEEKRPRTTQYSPDTGRIIPPPSRAYSRNSFRRSSRQHPGFPYGYFQNIAPEPDIENMVMTILCQILQTDDVLAVQSWLVSAGEREKAIVMDLIKSAMAGRDDPWKQPPPAYTEPLGTPTKLPPINNDGEAKEARIDRLVLDDSGQPQESKWSRAWTPKEQEPERCTPAVKSNPLPIPSKTDNDKELPINPPTSEMFQTKSSKGERTTSPPKEIKSNGNKESELHLPKFSEKDNGVKDSQKTWSQSISVSNTF